MFIRRIILKMFCYLNFFYLTSHFELVRLYQAANVQEKRKAMK